MFGMGGSQAKAATPAKKAAAARQPALVAVTVKLEPRQQEKLRLLGGDAWLRAQIDAARAATADKA